METITKLSILADAAKYDASCASSGSYRKRAPGGIGDVNGMGICHSYAPDGRCISLLKILLTNYCIYDCQFCINRISSNTPRARFTPEEVANLTIEFYKRNYIEGLFLSSGIIQSADYTMEQLIYAAEILRTEHLFNGYIHLKAIAGCSPELLSRAGAVADRISANIELARQSDLDDLAPAKKHGVIESTMTVLKNTIAEKRDARSAKAKKERPTVAGQSTQLIVGATPATDFDILSKASQLYSTHRLKRVYYSAFSPIPDSAPGVPSAAAPLMREHRLYQADWLQRFYGFSVNEIVNDARPQLSLIHDPKLEWALQNRAQFPVDINSADRMMLLRVPGFGVRTVDRIIQARKFQKVRLADLARMRVPLSKAKFFIRTPDKDGSVHLLDRGDLFVRPEPAQLSLFDAQSSAASGEL